MHDKKRAIEKLVHHLAERYNKLQQVLATNAVLRLRGAAIDVLMRVQDEVMQIRARLGLAPTAPFGGLSYVLQPDIRVWLLQRLPWLARGLDMADVSEEVAQSFEKMDISAARTAWQGLVAALLQATGPTEEAFAAARRICQFWTSMVVFNPLLYMEFQGTQLLTGQPATGSGDAPRQHWEAVMRATGLTKLQAMLVVELKKLNAEQLERINREQLDLIRLIEAETKKAGRLADVEVWEAPLSALMDSLQHVVRRQQTVIVMTSLSYRAVLTTQQFGRMMALSFPYPMSSKGACDVLARFVAEQPNLFHPEEAGVL